jgi:hypothetical protein
MVLRLEADELAAGLAPKGGMRWRWRLFDASGAIVATHRVAVVAGAWQWRALLDLSPTIAGLVDPIGRQASEQKLVGRVGRWVASEILGPVGTALAAAAPATVVVSASRGAGWLAGLPYGVARVGGSSLLSRQIAFATAVAPPDGRLSRGPVDRLRVLAVFPLPPRDRALDLRNERRSLVELVEGLRAEGRAIELRIVEYGVTPARLETVLADRGGYATTTRRGLGMSAQSEPSGPRSSGRHVTAHRAVRGASKPHGCG